MKYKNASLAWCYNLILYGLGSVLAYMIIVTLVSVLWTDPQYIFRSEVIYKVTSVRVFMVFLITSVWVSILYKSNLRSLKEYVLKGQSIGFMSFITFTLIISMTSQTVNDVSSFVEFYISFLVLGFILFGWVIVIICFITSYILYLKEVRKVTRKNPLTGTDEL